MPVLREHVLPLIGGFLKPKLPAMFTVRLPMQGRIWRVLGSRHTWDPL